MPQQPCNKQPGILLISEVGDAELRITSLRKASDILANGSKFGQIEPTESVKTYDRITGIVRLDNRSEFVTLDDCFYTSWNASFFEGVSTATIVANTVYLGVCYSEKDDVKFSKVIFTFEGLNEWLNISGFTIEHEFGKNNELQSATLEYSPPQKIRIDLANDDCKVEVLFSSSIPTESSNVEAKFSQIAYISLQSTSSRCIEELRSLVSKIQNFLCFAVDDVISLQSLQGYSKEITRDIGNNRTQKIPVEISYKSMPISESSFNKSWIRMLLPYPNIADQFPKMLNQWMEVYEKYEPALDLYFTALYGKILHLEVKFLLLVQGLEALHRRESNGTEFDRQEFEQLCEIVINSAPQSKQEFLRGRLHYANEISLRKRLKKMFKQFSGFFEFGGRMKSFISGIVDTRNYLTHYSSDLQSSAVKGKNLIFLNEKLEALFQLHLLRLMNLNSDEISEIANNHYSLKVKLKN